MGQEVLWKCAGSAREVLRNIELLARPHKQLDELLLEGSPPDNAGVQDALFSG
jgi:hypothetical protein